MRQPTLTMMNSVAALILDKEGRYLLQLRDDVPEIWFPDHWGLFGGAIDRDETREDALYREMKFPNRIAVDSSRSMPLSAATARRAKSAIRGHLP